MIRGLSTCPRCFDLYIDLEDEEDYQLECDKLCQNCFNELGY